MPLWPSDPGGLLEIGLLLVLEPSLKLGQRAASMRDLVLLYLVHLGKGLAFVLEDGIPSESGRSSRKHNLALQNRQRS
jgi:hypothetical protein